MSSNKTQEESPVYDISPRSSRYAPETEKITKCISMDDGNGKSNVESIFIETEIYMELLNSKRHILDNPGYIRSVNSPH